MSDTDFVYIAKIIFQFRGKNDIVHSEFDNISKLDINEDELKNKYFNGNELKLNLNDNNIGFIIDLLNYYEPNLNLNFIVNNEEQNLIMKRFKSKSQFDVHYEILGDTVFHLNNIHSGKISIKGDVNSISLLNLIESCEPTQIMRTDINIFGSLINNTLFFNKLSSIATKAIKELDDDSIFSMNINVLNDHQNTDLEVVYSNNVRCFDIEYKNKDGNHNFNVDKIHNLR